tara:strand:- start:163 stop:837 length:675 start_codon:yes stop_codon:yes gene_type:complete
MANFFLESVKEEPLTSLNDRNDLTRMAYHNKSSDIPLRNNSIGDRFESDNFINHKENFENNNSRINSLNEEIRELKDKLKFIYEKDAQIISLESECNTLKRDLEDFNNLKNELNFMRDENKLLSLKLKASDDLNEELRLDRVKEDNKVNDDKDDNKVNDDNKVKEDKEEQIIVDVLQLKRVLFSRLRDYHEKHIDELIDQYELNKIKEIDKSIMEKILLKAIHV